MLLEVILEADLKCPRCAKLEPMLRKICDELNIPFIVKYATTRSVAAYEESSASRTFSPEWIEKWGLPEHKRKLKKLRPILEYLQHIGAQTYPNVIIRWFDGARTREIIIRGFDPNSPKSKDYLRNLYTLLRILRRVIYR